MKRSLIAMGLSIFAVLLGMQGKTVEWAIFLAAAAIVQVMPEERK